MRYLLLLFLLLLPTLVLAQDIPIDPHEIHEQNLWTVLITVATSLVGLLGWAFRTWWKEKIVDKHKEDVERKLEEDWTNGDDTLPGKRNPGRTVPQLIEIVHKDLQQHKSETNRRFDKVHSDLGEIKGELKIINRGK